MAPAGMRGKCLKTHDTPKGTMMKIMWENGLIEWVPSTELGLIAEGPEGAD